MRPAIILFAVGALAAVSRPNKAPTAVGKPTKATSTKAVSDIDKLNRAFAETGGKIQSLADTIDKWDGSVVTAPDVAIKAQELRQSMNDFKSVIEGIGKISEADRKKKGVHVLRLADPALSLKETSTTAISKISGIPGARAFIHEMFKSEKKPYLDLLKATMEKMPGSISKSGVPGSPDNLMTYAMKVAEVEWEKFMKDLEPVPEERTAFDDVISLLFS
ncbi:hypothetical protein GQ602_002417 [Ophiocordyceps camponoti-floridani]|uniref:Cell wall protein n=1 Tax=Ophiocordyceps camponoti-floridani TaxID=2030778 RepID=A0A8H4QAC8_9HYPO|nr:hypothetical protein GQ602_002417 [Ophiocordyceps camponoti-floridani]